MEQDTSAINHHHCTIDEIREEDGGSQNVATCSPHKEQEDFCHNNNTTTIKNNENHKPTKFEELMYDDDGVIMNKSPLMCNKHKKQKISSFNLDGFSDNNLTTLQCGKNVKANGDCIESEELQNHVLQNNLISSNFDQHFLTKTSALASRPAPAFLRLLSAKKGRRSRNLTPTHKSKGEKN